jgi:hypothetical protein
MLQVLSGGCQPWGALPTQRKEKPATLRLTAYPVRFAGSADSWGGVINTGCRFELRLRGDEVRSRSGGKCALWLGKVSDLCLAWVRQATGGAVVRLSCSPGSFNHPRRLALWELPPAFPERFRWLVFT